MWTPLKGPQSVHNSELTTLAVTFYILAYSVLRMNFTHRVCPHRVSDHIHRRGVHKAKLRCSFIFKKQLFFNSMHRGISSFNIISFTVPILFETQTGFFILYVYVMSTADKSSEK